MKKMDLAKHLNIIEEIHTGGSDRRFFRCHKDNKTYILVLDNDIKTYLALQRHLYNKGIAVPKVYLIDQKTNFILVEDLGKDSLWQMVTKRKKDITRLYKLAILELIKLQLDGYPKAPINLFYDYEHIRWEQEYFRNFFLHQYCKIAASKLKTLDDDFLRLAESIVDKTKPINNFLMHRDYQSQNIFMKDGRARIVDFQSARIGPLTYDLVSLLKDPYVMITKKNESHLINFYLDKLKRRGMELEKQRFLEIYKLTGLQRNMQALGAFANLTLNKNKTSFEKYMPRGLWLLKCGLKDSPFKQLLRIVTNLESKKFTAAR